MKNLLEIREYKFDDGTTILLKLDRRKKTASLVEWDDFARQYRDKKFRFTDRGSEYMNGWLNILYAMEHVIKDARKVMDGWDKEDTDKLVNIMVRVQGDEDV